MKSGEVRQMNDEELDSELDRLRRHLFDLRSQAVTEKMEDTTIVQRARRDIARVLTVIRERQLQSA